MRMDLPPRREQIVVKLEHANTHYYVGFGLVPGCRQIIEVFADARRTGSDQEAVLHDACIAMSLLAQYGCSFAQQAEAYGELRNEGEKSGPPASVIGAIARMAVSLEKEQS